MNERPILFNTEMVRAILDGRKTQARRVIKPHKRVTAKLNNYEQGYGLWFSETRNNTADRWYIKDYTVSPCWMSDRTYIKDFAPYHPGDVLWVRETWGDYRECTEDGENGYFFLYRADYPDGAKTVPLPEPEKTDYAESWDLPRWHPSIHMPREAARIFLKVTDVRIEQLREITNQEAKAEGVTCETDYSGMMHLIKFPELWDSTVKPIDMDRYGWDANPWVWVIEFEKTEEATR